MGENTCTMCGKTIPKGEVLCQNCKNIEPSFDTTQIVVSLNKIADISNFVALASKCKDDVVVKTGNFAINAKSLMGLYSLDLSKPLKVEFYGAIPYEVKEGMMKFIVN